MCVPNDKLTVSFSNQNIHSILPLLSRLIFYSDCRMTGTSCLLYLYTHSDCRMTRTSCLLYLCTHSDCRMTRTSCLLYLCTHSDCIMTRTSCLLYLCTHSDCRRTIVKLLRVLFGPLHAVSAIFPNTLDHTHPPLSVQVSQSFYTTLCSFLTYSDTKNDDS